MSYYKAQKSITKAISELKEEECHCYTNIRTNQIVKCLRCRTISHLVRAKFEVKGL